MEMILVSIVSTVIFAVVVWSLCKGRKDKTPYDQM